MGNVESKRPRLFPLEAGMRAFSLQLDLFPEIRAEVDKLCGGAIGVFQAILVTIGDKYSYGDTETTTPQRIRELLGAPAEDRVLEKWRENFWNQFKKEQGLK